MSYDLYKGDCLIDMSNIEDHSVDMILCDLPYCMGSGSTGFACVNTNR